MYLVNFYYLIYRLIILPLSLLFSLLVGFLFIPKIRKGLLLRWHYQKPKQPTLPVIWIHCASGEFEYAKPVIRELKQMGFYTLVTYFSPSYLSSIQKDPFVDHVAPLPLDLSGPLKDFVDYFKPRQLLFSRTDLWPELVSVLKHKKIPMSLFSTTYSKKNLLSRWTDRVLYNQLHHIYAVSEEDKKHLMENKITTAITVAGDTRYDQVHYRLKNINSSESSQWISKDTSCPTLIAGSTWPEDESQILAALKSLLKNQQLRLILTPHEPSESHIHSIIADLKKEDLSFDLYTQLYSNWNSQVLVVDTIGVLAGLYQKAHFAFIGGSFKKKVHSVMEALGCGLVTFVGPYYQNNREAVQFKQIPLGEGLFAVNIAQDSTELEKLVQRALYLDYFKNSETISRQFQLRLGASKKLVKFLDFV